MNNLKSILSQVNVTLNSLPDWNNLSDFVSEFHHIWLKLGNFVQQQLVQARIDQIEAQYQSQANQTGKKVLHSIGRNGS